MKRQTLLVTLAGASLLLAALLVFLFKDAEPKFISHWRGKVEVVRNDFYHLPAPAKGFVEIREWRLGPATFEELRERAQKEFTAADGWTLTESRMVQRPFIQASNTSGALAIYFEGGEWKALQSRRVGTLDYYRAWIRSGGRLTRTNLVRKTGRASPKAGSPSKSP